jgi:hypothetical protein
MASPSIFILHDADQDDLAEEIASALKERACNVIPKTWHNYPEIDQSDVVLALLGSWIERQGFEHHEFQYAFSKEKIVIPALVDGAPMPALDELPNTIREFVSAHVVGVSVAKGGQGIDLLLREAKKLQNAQARPKSADAMTSRTQELAKPIFVSFSKHDQVAALEIVDRIEAADLKCWISCRDVPHGHDYQDAIVDALDAAGAMVLVFSSNANGSAEIKRELALSSANNLFILPVRIENAEPTKGFKYQLATRQYIDLFADRDKNMILIVNTLRKQLQAVWNPS